MKRFIVLVSIFIGIITFSIIGIWNSHFLGKSLPVFTSTYENYVTSVNPVYFNSTDQNAINNQQINSNVNENPDNLLQHTNPQKGTNEEAKCSKQDHISVLVLGIDENNQADAIRLVRIDFLENKISVLAIPRDSYLPIVDMKDHGIEIGRINATYGYGEYYNGKGMGVVSIAENVNYNYGITFDHYIAVSFDNVAQYIDILGGVDIILEQPVDGTLQNLGYYSQGEHHLNGESAIDFMRIRYIDSDFYRIRRQTQVFTALYDKVMTELTLGKILNIGYTFVSDSSVQSDFAVKDVAPLLCLAKSLKPSDIQFVEIPQEMYKGFTTPKGGAVKIPDDRVIELVQSVMGGNYQE